jgi:hypothetical protein
MAKATNTVELATMSLSASSPSGDDASYLEWHQLDHMPQQYEIPGLLYAQRWASTPECRAARLVQSERFEPTNHVVQYLFGGRVAEAVDEWFTLGAHLREVGRFPYRLPAVLLGGFEVIERHAAASASVTADIVPYRPNRGMYLVIEQLDNASEPAAWSAEHVEKLLGIDGVAGMWTFASAALRPDRFDNVPFGVAVCYLDGEPVDVAGPVADVVDARWKEAPVIPELAAPFVAVRAWEWERFRNPG